MENNIIQNYPFLSLYPFPLSCAPKSSARTQKF